MKWENWSTQTGMLSSSLTPCSHHSLFSVPDDAGDPLLYAHTKHCCKQTGMPYREQLVLSVKTFKSSSFQVISSLHLRFFSAYITVDPKSFAYGPAGVTQLAILLYGSITNSVTAVWQQQQKHSGYLQIKSESKKVWKFIIDREIEAPARFQAIQSYRCAPVQPVPPQCICLPNFYCNKQTHRFFLLFLLSV